MRVTVDPPKVAKRHPPGEHASRAGLDNRTTLTGAAKSKIERALAATPVVFGGGFCYNKPCKFQQKRRCRAPPAGSRKEHRLV
jgi:hypothetical protein